MLGLLHACFVALHSFQSDATALHWVSSKMHSALFVGHKVQVRIESFLRKLMIFPWPLCSLEFVSSLRAVTCKGRLDRQCLQSMFEFSRGPIQALLTLWPWPYKANPAVTSKHINIYTTRGWWKWREIFGWCEIWNNHWKSIESLFRIR